MNLPFEYDRVAIGEFGGTTPTPTSFDNARREILVASSHMELWDEETGADVHSVGIVTLPEMDFPFGTIDEVMAEIRRVAAEIVSRGKFPVVLGGEHSI